jgi:AraC-like DNA-binding protein
MSTALDNLGFQLIPPGPALRPFVRCYWAFTRAAPLIGLREEYMHPTGGYGIVFNFGDPVQLSGQKVTAPVFLDGTNTASSKMGFQGKVEQIGVSFWVGGGYSFLGVPLEVVRDIPLALAELDRAGMDSLYGRLCEAPNLQTRIALLEAWLLDRLRQGRERHPIVPETLAALRAVQGQVAIPTLADRFYISQRQLERLYKTQVGISPKQYAGLLRVEAARLALKHLQTRSLTDLAVEYGFYDQAHFIREFSAVVGLTPHRYVERSRQRDLDQPGLPLLSGND